MKDENIIIMFLALCILIIWIANVLTIKADGSYMMLVISAIVGLLAYAYGNKRGKEKRGN